METVKSMAKDPKRALLIGHNLKVDIRMGHKSSFKTLFVSTGIDSLDDLIQYTASKNAQEQMYVPDFYTNSLSDLVPE